MDLIRLNPSESDRIKLNQIDSKHMNFLQNSPNACEKLPGTTMVIGITGGISRAGECWRVGQTLVDVGEGRGGRLAGLRGFGRHGAACCDLRDQLRSRHCEPLL